MAQNIKTKYLGEVNSHLLQFSKLQKMEETSVRIETANLSFFFTAKLSLTIFNHVYFHASLFIPQKE